MSRPVVFIAEDPDPEDFSCLSGLFSAHLESDGDPPRFEEGPRSVSAEDAIAWGRQRAQVVLIRFGEEGYHSAGTEQPRGPVLPEWPRGGMALARRRTPRMAYLDRADTDTPIAWDISIDEYVEVVEPGVYADRFADAVANESDVSRMSYSWEQLDRVHVSVQFGLRARTEEEATGRGREIGEQAARAAWSAIPGPRGASTWLRSVGAQPSSDAS